MASNRSTQNALLIALSIFVMLTFALGVTTYLFFNKAEEALAAQRAAAAEAVDAGNKARQTADDMNTLRGIIGVAADVPVADVDTQLTGLFEGDFAGYSQDERSYLKLIEWLRQEYRDKNTRVKTVEEEKKSLAAQKAAEVAAAEKAKQDALAAAAAAKDAQSKDKADFDGKWSVHEEEQKKLTAARRAAEEKARDLEGLKAEIAKGLDYMPPTKKPEYRAAIEADNSVKQLDLLRFELRGRAKEIADLNALLARLRVADRDLQEAIVAARPADDRIDGFNGRVVSVDPRTGTALVSCRTTAGLRPGLVLHVFPPDDPQPEFGSRKGVVEITEVEGPTLIRAVIRRQSSRDLILAGDGVSSSLWAGGVSPDIVIVGFTDLDYDGRSDFESLRATVEQAGGRIVDAVAPNTALVVDLGQPSVGDDGREIPGWAAEAKRRSRNLDSAKTYNIRVTGVDGLLDMLGLDKESFRPGRLPKARAVGGLPARR
jgi:hypothetical protein